MLALQGVGRAPLRPGRGGAAAKPPVFPAGKNYGHRTGDRECPLFALGNARTEALLKASYDPMHQYMRQQRADDRAAAEDRIALCKRLLAEDVRAVAGGYRWSCLLTNVRLGADHFE